MSTDGPLEGPGSLKDSPPPRPASGTPPADFPLRTLASVPPAARVLDLECGAGRHTRPLALLGFDVWACDADDAHVAAAREALKEALGADEATRRITPARPDALGYPDGYFHWILAWGAFDSAETAGALKERLAEARRVLAPGGWMIVAMYADATGEEAEPDTLVKLMAEAGLALAERPAADTDEAPEGTRRLLRGVFRRVDPETVG